jgi:hypothetical protein
VLGDDQEAVARPAHAVRHLEVERRRERLDLVGDAVAVAVGHGPHGRLARADEQHVGRRRDRHVTRVGDDRVEVDAEAGRQLHFLQVLADRIGVAAGLRDRRDVEVGRRDLHLLQRRQVVGPGLRECRTGNEQRDGREQRDRHGVGAHGSSSSDRRRTGAPPGFAPALPAGEKCRPL